MAMTAAAKEGAEAGENMYEKMSGHEMHLAKELNLTTDQMDKLKAHNQAGEKQAIQDEADMKMIHADIKAEGMKDNPDMAKLETLTQKAGALHGKRMLTMIKEKMFFRSLLTSEQKRKMDQMKMDMGEMGEGHKMGMQEHGK
jgi:Spy/CpxP family protein refolding chaperone